MQKSYRNSDERNFRISFKPFTLKILIGIKYEFNKFYCCDRPLFTFQSHIFSFFTLIFSGSLHNFNLQFFFKDDSFSPDPNNFS